MEITVEEKVLMRGMLAVKKLDLETSLRNADKIEDKTHKSKTIQMFKNELKALEELQKKLSPFNA